MEKTLKRTGITVVLISLLFISFIILQSILYPRVLPGLYYEEIEQGSSTGIRTRINYVIGDSETWETLWTDMNNDSTSVPDLPYVNFTSEVVFAVFLGEFGTGGFVAEITRIEATISGLVIHIRETHPGPGCIVTMAITHPYHIVKASIASMQPVEFVYNLVVHNCP